MSDVLIVGAGPTGLVLALWLTQQGIGVRIVDKSDGPGQTSRAMAVQARTLELYDQLGIADAVVAAGHKNPTMNLWARGKRRAQISLGTAGSKVTPYPFILVYPQDLHERLLVERLRTLGIEVERKTEFVDFEDRGDHVLARLRLSSGKEETFETKYLAGCDGARSPIRHQLGNSFEGGTYKQLFYVADVELHGLEPADQGHIALDTADFVAILSYGNGKSRLIGTIQDDRADGDETLSFDDVGQYAIERLGVQVQKVNWFSTYRVHHRVTDRFRHGRVFLLGDAAHVHSPAGGQGMNTGISDAINLAWKLAAVLTGQAPDALLDSYDLERRAFARKLVDTTDRLFTFMTAEGSFADLVRTRIAPAVASVAYRAEPIREFMFRTISQTTVSYDDSPLSCGKSGALSGGDRLPWVRTATGHNYATLSEIGWQVHVYGEAERELQIWCEKHGLRLHVFEWSDDCGRAGLKRNGLYLLRPDTWIALVDSKQSVDVLADYFGKRGLNCASGAGGHP